MTTSLTTAKFDATERSTEDLDMIVFGTDDPAVKAAALDELHSRALIDCQRAALVAAIQDITADYDTAEGEIADPFVAVLELRMGVDHKEVDFWELEDEALAGSYHAVLDASTTELSQALRELIAK